jgi:hypothetical protein
VGVDLTPHPLVASVAEHLDLPEDTAAAPGEAFAALAAEIAAKPKKPRKKRDGKAAEKAEDAQQLGAGEPPPAGKPNPGHPEDYVPTEADLNAALALAGADRGAEVVTFAGFVGASVDRAGEKGGSDEWTILYLDSLLQSWLLVETTGIAFRARITAENSPFGFRDVIWIKANAPVGRGSGSISIESQFLTGEFTSAGDSRIMPTGGTMAAATGVFCESESIGCCRPSIRR